MPLQREFKGLLDHLGQYSGGSFPIEAGNTANLGVDLEDFVNPLRFHQFSGTTAAISGIIRTQVPDGEAWRVRLLACQYDIPAVTTALMVPVIADPAQTAHYGLDSDRITPGAGPALSSQRQGVLFAPPGLWVPPAWYLGFAMAQYTGAGGINVEGLVIYQKIKV